MISITPKYSELKKNENRFRLISLQQGLQPVSFHMCTFTESWEKKEDHNVTTLLIFNEELLWILSWCSHHCIVDQWNIHILLIGRRGVLFCFFY